MLTGCGESEKLDIAQITGDIRKRDSRCKPKHQWNNLRAVGVLGYETKELDPKNKGEDQRNFPVAE